MIKCYYSKNLIETLINKLLGCMIFLFLFYLLIFKTEIFPIKKEYDILNNLFDLFSFFFFFLIMILIVIQMVYGHLLYTKKMFLSFSLDGISINKSNSTVLFIDWTEVENIRLNQSSDKFLNVIISTKTDVFNVKLIHFWLLSLISKKCICINLYKLSLIINQNPILTSKLEFQDYNVLCKSCKLLAPKTMH